MADHHTHGKSRPRLREIARRADVSIATVSNVLNNKGRISRETGEKIREIMREMVGANGIEAADALPAKRGNIAFVSVDPSVKINHSSFHLQLIQGMQSILERQGYSIFLYNCLAIDDFNHHTRDADAAVVVGFPDDPELWRERSNIPIIWALRSTSRTADIVQEDNREIARIAADHLLGRGHRTVGYIDDLHVESLVERGWFLSLFMREAGGAVVVRQGRNIFTAGQDCMSIDREQTGELLRDILAARPRPTALFVPGDRLCVTVYSLLQEMGIRPQDDIDILSCNNDIPYLSAMFPRPATVAMNIDVIGRRAAETALWRMAHPHEPPIRVLIRPTLVLPR